VIAFGIAVSTILGRFVIPIYYVLGERLIDYLAGIRERSHKSGSSVVEGPMSHRNPAHEDAVVSVH
jgi:HAE1 family hydrophobic/amphiphilic exporter-1